MIGEKLVCGNLGGIMKYSLINCSENDINTIVEYKCNNIFEYATDITLEEKNKIINYVIKDINEDYTVYDYQIDCRKLIDDKEARRLRRIKKVLKKEYPEYQLHFEDTYELSIDKNYNSLYYNKQILYLIL